MVLILYKTVIVVKLCSNQSTLWQNFYIVTCCMLYLIFHHIFQIMSYFCCIWVFGCCDIQLFWILFYLKCFKKFKSPIQLLMELHLTAVECHLPWHIILDHTILPATWHKWTHPTLTPARQAGTRFTYSGGMEGWVELGNRLHAEISSLLSEPVSCPSTTQVSSFVMDCVVWIKWLDWFCFGQLITGLVVNLWLVP